MQNLQKLLEQLTRIRETNRPMSESSVTSALIQLTREVIELQSQVKGSDNARKE